MDVWVKKLDVAMEVKSSGIEFEVRTADGNSQIGDCYVTMTAIIWCKGKTIKKNGIKLTWDELAQVLRSEASKRAAVKAAKSA